MEPGAPGARFCGAGPLRNTREVRRLRDSPSIPAQGRRSAGGTLRNNRLVPVRVLGKRTFLPELFPRTLPRQSLFHAALFSRFQVVGVTLHFFDDVFRLNLTFESTERVLQGLALLQSNFCHTHLLHLCCAERVSDVPTLVPNLDCRASGSNRLQSRFRADAGIGSRFHRRIRFFATDIEQGCLRGSKFAQFGHLVHAALCRLLLFSLAPALGFVQPFLLSRVFLLTLCKR
jgi:hypothetical protein